MTFNPEMIAQYGGLAVVLGWFMFRFEKKIDAHTSIINDLVAAITLETVSRPGTTPQVQLRAEELLKRSESRKSVLASSA